MKKLCWLAALATMATAAFSDAGAAGEPTSVAIVQIQEVLNRSEYAKQMETSIRAGFKSEEQEIEDLQKLIRTESEKLQTDTMMSPDSYTYKDKVLQIERLKLKLADKAQNFSRQTRSKMAEFWRSVYKDFRAAIEQIAKSGQYDLILTAPGTELSNDAAQNDVPEAVMGEIIQRRVQYVAPKIDITQKVIDMMNAINRGRGAK
ncbi:MAG: OmpH family outer membrane protein [Planctomycetota bacterium]|nr:OmpH family outer membrane protein [Planctomycetota bacterium]